MQISQHLPSFMRKERALFIVTGRQIGKLYTAEKGNVREVALVEEPKLRYSDNEGFFMRGGGGRTYGSGAVREPKGTETKQRFLKKFSAKVAEVVRARQPEAIYLFTPDYAVTELKEELPPEAQRKIRFAFLGNFVKFGPQKLLAKVDEKMARLKEKSGQQKEEETKILKLPRETARRKGKG